MIIFAEILRIMNAWIAAAIIFRVAERLLVEGLTAKLICSRSKTIDLHEALLAEISGRLFVGINALRIGRVCNSGQIQICVAANACFVGLYAKVGTALFITIMCFIAGCVLIGCKNICIILMQ